MTNEGDLRGITRLARALLAVKGRVAGLSCRNSNFSEGGSESSQRSQFPKIVDCWIHRSSVETPEGFWPATIGIDLYHILN